MKIKSCPFCGGKAELITRQGKTYDGRVYDCYRVTCKNVDCEVTTFDFSTPKKAVRVWNRRVNNG